MVPLEAASGFNPEYGALQGPIFHYMECQGVQQRHPFV